MKTHLLHIIAYKKMNMHYMQNPVFSYNPIALCKYINNGIEYGYQIIMY